MSDRLAIMRHLAKIFWRNGLKTVKATSVRGHYDPDCRRRRYGFYVGDVQIYVAKGHITVENCRQRDRKSMNIPLSDPNSLSDDKIMNAYKSVKTSHE